MPTNDAILLLSDDDGPQLSLYKSRAGSPETMAATITRALAGYRKSIRRTAASLVPRLVSTQGFADSGAWRVFPHAGAIKQPHAWRYELTLEFRANARIVVYFQADGKYEEKYRGGLEFFLSRALRKRIKPPRGRTPSGYASREEYELAMIGRRANMQPAPQLPPEPWQTAVAKEQRAAPLPPIDLRGVRVRSKEETLASLRRKKR